MADKKQLNQEQLDDVNGGKDMAAYLPKDHGIHIGMYDAEHHIGEKFYIVQDINREQYYWGTLLNSYEEKSFGHTLRMHLINVEGCNDYWLASTDYVGKDIKFSGDNWTLFLYN